MAPASAGAMLASMVQGGGDISALLNSIAAVKKATTGGSPAGSAGAPGVPRPPAPPAGAPKGLRGGDSPGASTGASKENQPPRLGVDFDPSRDDEAELRRRREYLIDAMYADRPHQCASTGRRFDDRAELDAHLDLQALRRRKRKEGSSSRRWCVDSDAWIAGAAAEAADDAPAFFEIEHAKKEEDARNAVDVNSSVAKEDDVTHCALSGEPFEVFYNEDEDEWHFKRATRLPRDYKGVPAGSIVLVTALPKDGNYDDEDDEEEDEEEEEEEEEVVEEPAPEIKEEPEPEPATKKRKAAVKVKEEVKEEKVEAAVEPVATRRSKRRKSE